MDVSRTELLIGKEGIKKLEKAKVAVFGIGGVGSYVVEGLTRVGIKKFVLVDYDSIDKTNLNRQIHATSKTIGKDKVQAMKERIKEINPEANVETYQEFFLPNTNINFIDSTLSYIVDAMDTVTAKIELILQAKTKNIPIISSMGTGNKLDPTKFEVTDIYQTSICPLAKVMRQELRKREIKQLKVVYSKEIPIEPKEKIINDKGKMIPGSISFVPSVAGLIIAGQVVTDILNKED